MEGATLFQEDPLGRSPGWSRTTTHSLVHSKLRDIYSLQSTRGTVGGGKGGNTQWVSMEAWGKHTNHTQTLPHCDSMKQFKIFFPFFCLKIFVSVAVKSAREEKQNKGNVLQVSSLLLGLVPTLTNKAVWLLLTRAFFISQTKRR